MHIKLAKAGCCLTDRSINCEVYDAISKRIPFVMSLKQSDPVQRTINRLENVLLDEEAYDLVESAILDFYDTFTVHRHEEYTGNYSSKITYRQELTLNGPRFHCCHYDECRANIYGHDNEFETYGTITNEGKVTFDGQWGIKHCDRLDATTAKLKMVKLKSLVVVGHRGLGMMKKAFDAATVPDTGQNLDIVRHMFTFQNRSQHIESITSCNPTQSDTLTGETSFARKALIKAVAAKNELKAIRPFVFVNSAWTCRIAWLSGLISNLKAIHKAKVGILPISRL